jgi:hypothetical protein
LPFLVDGEDSVGVAFATLGDDIAKLFAIILVAEYKNHILEYTAVGYSVVNRIVEMAHSLTFIRNNPIHPSLMKLF